MMLVDVRFANEEEAQRAVITLNGTVAGNKFVWLTNYKA
jgi:hypothetical protein